MSDEQEQDSSPLVPIEQQTIMFYGKPLVVVHLPDGRPGIVLRHICDNLQLEPTSQVRRIKRTEAIADDLVYTQVQTDGGPQIMPSVRRQREGAGASSFSTHRHRSAGAIHIREA